MPIPEGLDILQDGDAVVIRRSWFSHIVWFLVFFCIAWDSFLIFWYRMALFGSDQGPSSFHLIAILFPIGHVAVGLGLTYFVFCLFLNQTDAILRPDTLAIQTHPLPWRGNQTIPVAEPRFVFSAHSDQRLGVPHGNVRSPVRELGQPRESADEGSLETGAG
jgi:hypothetical protein